MIDVTLSRDDCNLVCQRRKFIYKHAETDMVHLKYMQVILSPTSQKSALIVLCRIMAAALVGLLLLAAISMADKFDEENYGVKVQCTRTRRIFL